MPDLREQLVQRLPGRICLMGIGNMDRGDDGLGVRLAEAVAANRLSSVDGVAPQHLKMEAEERISVMVAGTTPERYLGQVTEAGFDHVVFLDAVEFGGAPGSVIFLNAEEMTARFPQVSTHRISLSVLAKWIEASGPTQTWLLGVQPESLKQRAGLSPVVQTTLELLAEWLGGLRDAARSRPLDVRRLPVAITRSNPSPHAADLAEASEPAEATAC